MKSYLSYHLVVVAMMLLCACHPVSEVALPPTEEQTCFPP